MPCMSELPGASAFPEPLVEQCSVRRLERMSSAEAVQQFHGDVASAQLIGSTPSIVGPQGFPNLASGAGSGENGEARLSASPPSDSD